MKARLRTLSAVGLVLAAACASAGGGAEEETLDPDAPLACIAIDNRQGSGTLENLYLVDASRRSKEGISGNFSTAVRTGEGVRIGDALVGRVTRFCTQSVALPGTYFIRVERAPADNFDPADQVEVAGFATSRQSRMIETEDIVLEPGDLWTWEVRRDRWSCRPNAATPSGDC